MSTPVLVGLGAIGAALVGRHLVKSGVIGGKRAADQWVKGGFKAKMDRKEALDILGLKEGPLASDHTFHNLPLVFYSIVTMSIHTHSLPKLLSGRLFITETTRLRFIQRIISHLLPSKFVCEI
ncbi:hypothetical protein OPQ81_001831 [Rhizoctonia solani]|nr:hypothetical protein OPQ81_001831 [Rhizoctonia solani]